MEKEHFEILLEKLEDNSRMLAEGLVMTNERLDRMEANTNERFDRVETALLDLRSIASNHEARLQ